MSVCECWHNETLHPSGVCTVDGCECSLFRRDYAVEPRVQHGFKLGQPVQGTQLDFPGLVYPAWFVGLSHDGIGAIVAVPYRCKEGYTVAQLGDYTIHGIEAVPGREEPETEAIGLLYALIRRMRHEPGYEPSSRKE